ncbi:MAG TPA: response regulator transcription factor, partial [Solirubrobacteraceae bacterium]
ADDLSRKARAYHPDVAVVDIDMPLAGGDGDCVEAARRIRALDPRTAVMALSRRADERYALAVLGEQPEGFGYLLKTRIRDVEDFTASVRRVAAGGSAIDPRVVSRLAGRHENPDPIGDLTARERQVLALIAEGRSNSSIASGLVVTIAAVERHITSIFGKLGLPPDRDDHRRVLAVLRYLGR